MKQRISTETVIMGGALLAGLILIIFRQAWRESHRGGFAIFSMQTLHAIVPILIITALAITAVSAYCIALYLKNRR